MMKVIAIVPIKYHSERIPGKNWQRLGDKPLMYHVIKMLLSISEIDKLVINTDHQFIVDLVNEMFDDKRIMMMNRELGLRGDDVSMNLIIRSTLERLDLEENCLILQTHTTNPFLKRESVIDGLNRMMDVNLDCTVLMSVTQHQSRFWSSGGAPINHSIDELIQTQKLEPLNEENSGMYIFGSDMFKKYGNRLGYYGTRRLMYKLDFPENCDIDDMSDLLLARNIMTGDARNIMTGDARNIMTGDTNPVRICDTNPRNIMTSDTDPRNIMTCDNAKCDSDKDLFTLLKKSIDFRKIIDDITLKLLIDHGLNKTIRILITAPYMMEDYDIFAKYYEWLLNGRVVGNHYGMGSCYDDEDSRCYYGQISKHLKIEVIKGAVNERLSSKDLLEYGHFDILIAGDDEVNDEVLSSSGCIGVCKWGTGIDSYDLVSCKNRGVMVRNTPNAFTVPVAQSIVGGILALIRGTWENHRIMSIGGWCKVKGRTMDEISVGIIGLGNVGSQVAMYLDRLDCGCLFGYDVKDVSGLLVLKDVYDKVEMVEDLKELMSKSDVVCCCCDLNDSNIGMINDESLGWMRDGSCLINMARGRLVNERALLGHIDRLGGVVLDVFEEEPLRMDSELREKHNVIMSSHNSNSSLKYWNKVHVNTVKNSLLSMKDLLNKWIGEISLDEGSYSTDGSIESDVENVKIEEEMVRKAIDIPRKKTNVK